MAKDKQRQAETKGHKSKPGQKTNASKQGTSSGADPLSKKQTGRSK